MIFVVQAYQEELPNMQVTDVCTLELFAENENQAIKRAKGLINKNFYRITQVFEKEDKE